MKEFFLVAQQVAVLFILMGAGVAAGRAKLIDDRSIKGFVNVLILIVTPCLLVTVFNRPFDRSMLGGLALAAIFALATHFVMILIARLTFRRSNPDSDKVNRLAAVFSNAGFMGVPLEQAILGPDGVFYGAVYIAVFNLMMWSWGYGTMHRADGTSATSQTKRFNPMYVNPGTIGLSIGLLLFLSPVSLPKALSEPIRLMSDLNTPLAMLVIGYYLGQARLDLVVRRPCFYLASFERLILCPLLVIAALLPFHAQLNRTLMLAIVIPAATPVAAMVTMFASRFERDVDLSVGLVSGTTLLSLVTIPALIAFAMILF